MRTQAKSPSGRIAPRVRPIDRYELRADEAAALRAAADRLVASAPHPGPEPCLDQVVLLGHELPWEIRQRFIDFKIGRSGVGGFVLAGIPLDDAALGPTPLQIPWQSESAELRRVDAILLLLGSLLGDPFSHVGVQEGRLILDICPLHGNEETQLASSSSGGLAWHNEDAYHDFRADWLLLMCLRNPQAAATSFARIRDVPVDARGSDVLFRHEFLISPDSSHSVDANELGLKTISVLSGDRESPFVRIDPAFMSRDLANADAGKALAALIDAFDENLQDVVLEAGEVLVIDNLRAVHGRRPFEARYDGHDRWLRSVNITADLRKSEGCRTGPQGRALLPESVRSGTGRVAGGPAGMRGRVPQSLEPHDAVVHDLVAEH
ncbi:TauD/TfdA family dioxygenase [Cryptosporangium minutisporangium]|uniref:TauD/TfdA-like domain-containing protein n=1 Tax=Cryptosporangium minutisporangium TaxID=113569 RepID=A0ABP6TCP9_9ACTN